MIINKTRAKAINDLTLDFFCSIKSKFIPFLVRRYSTALSYKISSNFIRDDGAITHELRLSTLFFRSIDEKSIFANAEDN